MPFRQRAETIPLFSDVCLADRECKDVVEQIDQPVFADQLDEWSAEALDTTVRMAETWGELTGRISEEISMLRIEGQQDNTSSSRDSRRDNARRRDFQFNQDIARMRQSARQQVRVNGNDEWGKRLSAVRSQAEYDQLSSDLTGQYPNKPEGNDDLTELFRLMFLTEHVTRLYMRALDLGAPDVFRQVFTPGNIIELPPALQKVSVIDISRGKDSIILQNAARTALEDNRTPAEKLTDYIQNNHLPDNVRQFIIAIKTGAIAAGVRECPGNDLGICTRLLAKIPIAELPEPIRKDIEMRDNKEAQDRKSKLVTFAQGYPLSRLLDSSTGFDVSTRRPNEDNNANQKRRPNIGVVEKRDVVTLLESAETEQSSFTQVAVRFINDFSEPLILTKGEEEQSIDEKLAHLCEHKLIKEYLETHKGTPLEGLMQDALRQILLSPNYFQSEGAILPWVRGIANRYKSFINNEGVKERLMRFSAARSSVHTSDKVGRQTRIFFSQGTKDGVRHVTIHEIGHKSDLEKRGPALR